MRVQFGQHNPVDRRRWRHEIDFVILSTCVLQVRRISFLDPSSQITLLRMTTREINLHIALHRHSEGAERPKNLDPSPLRGSG